jgi:hypothetical protein
MFFELLVECSVANRMFQMTTKMMPKMMLKMMVMPTHAFVFLMCVYYGFLMIAVVIALMTMTTTTLYFHQ